MLKQNLPNAGKLVNSLRSTGYDNAAAVCDLIDNSIDADATIISIDINYEGDDTNIVIADNGLGMNEKILFEALKLGSLTDRDINSDLGKYGMGLVTASWSMCRKILVLTKDKDGKILRNEIDIDVIQEKNEFLCSIDVANEEEANLFKKYIKNGNGTVVILSKCDRIQNKNAKIFSDRMRRIIGQAYRYFIDSGIRFIINDVEAKKVDPLMLGDSETEIVSDEKYEIFIKEKNLKESIRVKVALLPNFSQKLSEQMGINLRNQGFYILRNNREIAEGKTLDLFNRHNILNRLRIELFFSGNIDEEMGVNFIKQNIAPNQQIVDKLQQEIKGQIETIRRRMYRETKKEETENISHEDAEKIIANQAKLLITPEAEIEKRQSPQKRAEAKKQIRESKKRIREQFPEVHLSRRGMGCKFFERSMGEGGPIFEADQKGKLIIVEWNSDHSFYKKFVLANKDNEEIVTAADLLVYAMATAELKTFNSDENFDMLVNYKTVISANLRTLLS